MSVTNVRTEVQVSKSESPDNSISFPVRDQQYQKFSDNNQNNYSGGNILFDLQSIANSQQFLSFADSFIIVPVVQKIEFEGGPNALNVYSFRNERTKLISTIKGTALSILNGVQLEVNNEQVLAYTTGAHVPMEFMQISSNSSDDFELGPTNDAQFLDAASQESSVYSYKNGSSNVKVSAANLGTPWLPLSGGTAATSAFTTTGTNNSSYYKKVSKLASNARNDVVTAFFDPTLYTAAQGPGAGSAVVSTQLRNSRISYVDVENSIDANQQSGLVGVWYYYLKLPLPLMHDFFKQAPLVKGLTLRLTLYVHLPLTYTFTGKSVDTAGTLSNVLAPTTDTYKTPTSETLNNVTNYMPFSFSFPGPEISAPTAISGATADAAYTYTITAAVSKLGDLTAGMSACEFWAKLITLASPAETAILREPKKTIIFQDFQRVQQAQMIDIPPNNLRTFNVHSGIRRPRGMLITSESRQLDNLFYSASALVHSGGVAGLPFFTQSNLQIRLGGKNIWNWNIEYGYDIFEREIRGLNNAAGNMESALRTGSQISFNNWLRENGYIFVDLSKHVASEDNSYFSIDMDIKNPFAQKLTLVCYIFYEKEISMNIQTGQLFA